MSSLIAAAAILAAPYALVLLASRPTHTLEARLAAAVYGVDPADLTRNTDGILAPIGGTR